MYKNEPRARSEALPGRVPLSSHISGREAKGVKMKTQTTSVPEEQASEFLLAEYTALRELRLSLESLGENRVNFFFAAISGSAVGLGLINQLSVLAETLYFVNGAVFVGLFFFGLMTFARMVERSIRITAYTRAMNRIRRYFADKHPDITQYLWLPLHDDRPAFGFTAFNLQTHRLRLTGLAPMTGVINSIIATTGMVILVRGVFTLPRAWAVLIGTFTFLFITLAQYRYLMNRMRHKRDETEVRFPTPGKISESSA